LNLVFVECFVRSLSTKLRYNLLINI